MLVSGIDARRVFLKGRDLTAFVDVCMLHKERQTPGTDVPGLAMSRALGDAQASLSQF